MKFATSITWVKRLTIILGYEEGEETCSGGKRRIPPSSTHCNGVQTEEPRTSRWTPARKNAWDPYEKYKNKKAKAKKPAFEEYEDMSGIDEWHTDDVSEDPPEDVIPESFLWAVLNQLADAFSVLSTGKVATTHTDKPSGFDEAVDIDGEAWKEIRHLDVHIMNIFAKTRDGAKGTRKEYDNDRASDESCFVEFKPEEFPQVAFADFDKAFFDLQSPGDDFPDYPEFYLLDGTLSDAPGGAGRYPPELYRAHEGQSNAGGERLTSKTDVWGVGYIM